MYNSFFSFLFMAEDISKKRFVRIFSKDTFFGKYATAITLEIKEISHSFIFLSIYLIYLSISNNNMIIGRHENFTASFVRFRNYAIVSC